MPQQNDAEDYAGLPALPEHCAQCGCLLQGGDTIHAVDCPGTR
jgi:hypothetical protein